MNHLEAVCTRLDRRQTHNNTAAGAPTCPNPRIWHATENQISEFAAVPIYLVIKLASKPSRIIAVLIPRRVIAILMRSNYFWAVFLNYYHSNGQLLVRLVSALPLLPAPLFSSFTTAGAGRLLSTLFGFFLFVIFCTLKFL